MTAKLKAALIRCLVAISLAFGLPLPSHAQENPLTLEQVLEVARRRAPTILAARARIEEEQGRLRGASILVQQNPSLETAVGPRISDRGRFSDAEVTASQDFELGGRRRARMAGAQAGVERETATAEEVARRLFREVAVSFLEALAARERQFLLAATDQVAAGFLSIAERRYQAGDIPILEVNLARSSAARARSGLRIADADFALAMGTLRVLLGLAPGESLTIRGALRDRPSFDLEALLTRAQTERPDLRSLAAELRQAEADVRLGEGFRWPDLGVSTHYQREEGANVFQGGLKITLPVFSRGQELRATGNARGTRLRLEMEALRSTIQQEIRTALESYQRRTEAADELEHNALPSLAENETLAQRGYEEGEIGLAELLLIRREILETRRAYVDILLETRLTAIEVEFRAGVLQ